MKKARITPPQSPPRTCAVVPGSKSITNRVLPLAAFAEGKTTVRNILVADDSLRMIEALETLGFGLEAREEALEVLVEGSGGGVPESEAEIYAHQAGTVMRFLSSMLSAGKGRYRLDGDARMRERPIGPLVEALRALGAEVSCLGRKGFPPLEIRGGAGPGKVRVDASISSQFISGLLMEGALHSEPTEILLEGKVVSRPFIDVTLGVLRTFAARAEWADANTLLVCGPLRSPGEYVIEADATAAGYFWAAAAITGGTVSVGNLPPCCLQGDAAFADVLRRMGCEVSTEGGSISVTGRGLKGGVFDLNRMPDLVQTLAVTALFAEGPTRIENIGNLRFKETDRIAALQNELPKLGAEVASGEDWLQITPSDRYRPAPLETYGDHRMAMSLALAGLRIPGVEILEPDCVDKTFPEYFSALSDTLGAGVEFIEEDD